MKLISWNVNGIRSVLKKGFLDFVRREDADALCLQETKADDSIRGVGVPPHPYQSFWNFAGKKGYSGTALFTKKKPLNVTMGVGIKEHDSEGRVITAEFDDFFLVNVYTPNAKRDLSRLDYRQVWDRDFLTYLKNLEKGKPVVFCGDLNVAHKELDLTHPEANVKNHGFTPEERAGFDRIVSSGFLDTFREFYEDGGHYTWWSQFHNCRRRNIGWRIDYFCVSKSLRPRLRDTQHLTEVMGSDHCPVVMEMDP